MRTGDWMQTASGLAYYPLDPSWRDINLDDIAHALSHLCRFGGHCRRFYSVAEHSVLVSYAVPAHQALAGLMHDATEAYVVDVPRPLKHGLENYDQIEARTWREIVDSFWRQDVFLPYRLDPLVKDADNAVLLTEKTRLLGPSPMAWSVPGTPAPVKIHCHWPAVARWRFKARFHELVNGPSWRSWVLRWWL